MNFEQGTKELEKIIEKLDSKNVTLEESIVLFEQGVKISKECLALLNESKGKITMVKEELDSLLEVPFEIEQ